MLSIEFFDDFKIFYAQTSDNVNKNERCEIVSTKFFEYLENIGKIKLSDNLLDHYDDDVSLRFVSTTLYESTIEICNGEIVITHNLDFPLIFNQNCFYYIIVDGLKPCNYDEGESSNYAHNFHLLFVDGKWKILDSFVNQRPITLYDVDISELKSFIEHNEKKLNCDDYNKFFNVNITNDNNITNLNFIIEEYEYS